MADSTDNARYTVESDFYRTARVSDIELSVSSKGLSRKVLRATLVDNPKAKDNSVELCIVHQKRRKVEDEWADVTGATLAQTTVSTPSRLSLDTAETRALFRHLENLYGIGTQGIRRGQATVEVLRNEEQIIRTDSSRAQLIRKLLESNYGSEVWELLVQLEPDLAKKLSVSLAIQERQRVLDQFEHALTEEHDEHFWQQLIGKNLWILGSGNVALLDERRIDIKSVADLPVAIEGGFMDIVELKRHDVPFWAQRRSVAENFRYRDKFLIPDYGLQGAIAQTSHYILQAEKHVADSDFHTTHGIKPLKPRGLIVHGRSIGWGDEEWEAFRLLNDHLNGIQVMTFDHLLAQGRRALSVTGESG
jgi:Domain of unknown function (DUF4263)